MFIVVNAAKKLNRSMAMTNHEFEIWLATWRYKQKQVAEELGITADTICNFKKRERYPKWFALALKGLEK